MKILTDKSQDFEDLEIFPCIDPAFGMMKKTRKMKRRPLFPYRVKSNQHPGTERVKNSMRPFD